MPILLCCGLSQNFKGFFYLNHPPRPDAILFVVARALVHNPRSVATPNWRILIVEIESAFRIGRKCTERRTFRKIESKYLRL